MANNPDLQRVPYNLRNGRNLAGDPVVVDPMGVIRPAADDGPPAAALVVDPNQDNNQQQNAEDDPMGGEQQGVNLAPPLVINQNVNVANPPNPNDDQPNAGQEVQHPQEGQAQPQQQGEAIDVDRVVDDDRVVLPLAPHQQLGGAEPLRHNLPPAGAAGVGARPVPQRRAQRSTIESTAGPSQPKPTAPDGCTRVGSHSVLVRDVVPTDLSVPASNVTQNVFTRLRAGVVADGRCSTINPETRVKTLSSTLTLPSWNGNVPIDVVAENFTHFHNRGEALERLDITFGQPVMKDQFKLDIAPAVLRGSGVSTRAIADLTTNERAFSRPVAEAMAGTFVDGTRRWNVSAIYTIGALIEFQLRDLIARQFQPIFGAVPANTIRFVRVNPDPGHVEESIATLCTAIQAGVIILDGKRMSDMDLMVLQVLSMGPSNITTDNRHPVHVMQSVHSPPLQFLIYTTVNREVPPVAGVTPVMVAAALNRLALALRNNSDLVKGYTRAATIYTGRIRHDGAADDRRHRWVCATGEVNLIEVPTPLGHNFVWDLCCMIPQDKDDTAGIFHDEFMTIAPISTDERIRVSLLVGSLFSVCVGSVFNVFNLTGTELNSFGGVAGENNNAYVVVQSLLTPDPTIFKSPIMTLFSVACTIPSTISDIAINESCFATPMYCSGGANIVDWGENALWRHWFPDTVPYFTDVLSISWIFERWLDVWGVSSPGGEFNVTEELQHAGMEEDAGLYFRFGDDRYMERAVSDIPYTYVSYGGIVINTIAQHFRHNLDSITREYLSSRGKSAVHVRFPMEEGHNYAKRRLLYTILPGQIMTFAWRTLEVVAPVLLANDLPPGTWGTLHAGGAMKSPYTGLQRRRIQTNAVIQTGFYGIQAVIKGYGTGQGESATPLDKPATRAEN